MNDQPSIFRRLFERVFPKMPNFFALLTEQCEHVAHTTGLLVEFMEGGEVATGDRIRQDENEADRIKIHNLHTLNEAFSTPIDREDLYRAIIDLDEIVNYCKSTVSEMGVSSPFARRSLILMATPMMSTNPCRSRSGSATLLLEVNLNSSG